MWAIGLATSTSPQQISVREDATATGSTSMGVPRRARREGNRSVDSGYNCFRAGPLKAETDRMRRPDTLLGSEAHALAVNLEGTRRAVKPRWGFEPVLVEAGSAVAQPSPRN